MSNSCWKSPEELGAAIRKGLEVPNCIPDKLYSITEAQYFIQLKNRELSSQYKKAYEWLHNVLETGDKEYAEKLLSILDKWKRSYEDKIRTAKSTLREEIKIPSPKKRIKDFRIKALHSLKYYDQYIKDNFDTDHQISQLNHLSRWYTNTIRYLDSIERELELDPFMEVKYTPFGLVGDIDEMIRIPDFQKILESVESEIQRALQDQQTYKEQLRAMIDSPEYEKALPAEKKVFMDTFVEKYKKNFKD